MKIKNISLSERPRERLIRLGSQALMDYELLAIMLGSGNKEQSVLELANALIEEYGLTRLLSMDFNELSKIKGIKQAKASKLMACFEIAKRCMNKKDNFISLLSAKEVYEFVSPDFMFLKQERLMILYVDVKCRVIHKSFLYDFNVSEVCLPIRKIIGDAINLSAYGIFLIHNHPSGDITPSISDIESTEYLKNLLAEVNIIVLDHLIVSDVKFYSFMDNKILK